MKSTSFGYWHYTMSCWKNEEDIKRFAHSGAHLEAMKSSRKISTEIRIYAFSSDQMPRWKEAKLFVAEKGRVFSFK